MAIMNNYTKYITNGDNDLITDGYTIKMQCDKLH